MIIVTIIPTLLFGGVGFLLCLWNLISCGRDLLYIKQLPSAHAKYPDRQMLELTARAIVIRTFVYALAQAVIVATIIFEPFDSTTTWHDIARARSVILAGILAFASVHDRVHRMLVWRSLPPRQP